MAWLHSAKVDGQAAIECAEVLIQWVLASILCKSLHWISVSFVLTLSVKFRLQNFCFFLLKVFVCEYQMVYTPNLSPFLIFVFVFFPVWLWKVYLGWRIQDIPICSHKIVFLWCVCTCFVSFLKLSVIATLLFWIFGNCFISVLSEELSIFPMKL